MKKQKIVLKLDIHGRRHRDRPIKAVSSLQGIDMMSVDRREGKMTVMGTVDPVDVVGKLRRWFPNAVIVSVGPAKEQLEKEAGEKKVESRKKRSSQRRKPAKKRSKAEKKGAAGEGSQRKEQPEKEAGEKKVESPKKRSSRKRKPAKKRSKTEKKGAVEEGSRRKEQPEKEACEKKVESRKKRSHWRRKPLHEFTFGFLNRITNGFSEELIIGRGRYGVIYKGTQDNGICIAVKKLHLMPGLDDEDFKNEFYNLVRVRHHNTILLVGYCHHITQVLVEHNGKQVSASVEERSLCSEYWQGGSLEKHLSNGPCALAWHTCYKIITGICEGLHYLHKGLDYPIYHLELKPTKILLDNDMMPKIGGFGFSRLFDTTETFNTSEVAQTSVYMPPEYINKRQITPKFDVFSLGIIILQIMAGRESYTKCADIPHEEFIERVCGFWVNGMQGKISKHTSREVRTCIEIALKCVESSFSKRPTIKEIIQRLNKVDIVECSPSSSICDPYRTREFAFEFLEHITNGFSEKNKVGRGGYGVIYKGVLDNGDEIAVKKLHQTLSIDDELFKKEVNNLIRAQHENIVRLLGYCHHTSQIFIEHEGKHVSASVVERAICFEYMQGGNLDDQLSAESCKLDWDKCYKIIKGICEGLLYLHSAITPMYHLDLKPANILLDKNMTAKIGDFGLSRLFDTTQTYITTSQVIKGTHGYMPPEYINEHKISRKFDVFSLGVIIIQMMAGKEGYFNYPHTPPKEFIENVCEKWQVRLQATMPSHESEEVRTCIELALKCVEDDRTQRPTIAHIVNELSNIGIPKSSSVGQGTSGDTFSSPQQVPVPQSQQGGGHEDLQAGIQEMEFSEPLLTSQVCEPLHDLTVPLWKQRANKLLTALKTLLSTHFNHWLFLLVAAIAICFAWAQLCPDLWCRGITRRT